MSLSLSPHTVNVKVQLLLESGFSVGDFFFSMSRIMSFWSQGHSSELQGIAT